jgi:hypothetical protein
MAIEKVVNITVNTKGGQQAIAQTEKLNQKFKQLNQTTGELKTGLKDSGNAILENGGAMGLLNDATGGVAMTIKDAVEATGLFTKGTAIATGAQKIYTLVVGSTTGALKALRIALVSTGLGAIVVLLGVFVSKMMESEDASGKLTEQQERLNAELADTKKLTDDLIKSLDFYTNLALASARKRGASERELKKIEIDGINAKLKANTDEINQIKATQDQEYKLTKEQNARIQALREQNQDLVRQGRLSVANFEADQTVKEREEKLKADADLQAKLLENKRKADEEKKKLEEEYQKSLQEGLNEFQIAVNNAQFEQRRLDIEAKQKQLDDFDLFIAEQKKKEDEKFEYDKKLAEERKILEESVGNAKVDIAFRTTDLIKEIVGEGSKVGKALSIAQATISGIEGVQNAFTTASKSPITTLFPAYPFIQAGLAGAFSLLQIKKIASTDPSGKSGAGAGASSGAGAGASIPSAPSFNLVQGTGANQIAEGLAGQRQPIQAYVVSGAVTSAQQLERNIVNDASL